MENTSLHSKTWRSAFYLSAGIAALIAVGGALTVDPDLPSEEKDRRVDWLGSVLITCGLVLIIFALGDGAIAPRGWHTPCKLLSMSCSVLRQRIRTNWESPARRGLTR